VGLLGALLPLRMLAELVNIGTLLAFGVVCTAVLIMRSVIRRSSGAALWSLRAPDRHSILLTVDVSLPAENWFRLIVWLLLGIVIYFGYSKRHSVLARMRDRESPANLSA
jgi:APA family basic amino acid/polyamine antiporter